MILEKDKQKQGNIKQRKKTMDIVECEIFLLGSTYSTFGRGFLDSKGVAR
jgi:hypothetical protein